MPETPYMETEALLAILNEDDELAAEIVAGMLDKEVAQYVRKIKHLLEIIAVDVRRRQHQTWVDIQGEGGVGSSQKEEHSD